ncbi:MAG: TetR/AcrR family transcriptional regulator [Acidobacteriota bacterium]
MEVTTKASTLFDDDRAGVIYRTAARMIYEKGFDATSMNEIAEALDLTKPGLYYYVKGKKQLLYSIMDFAMDLLDSNVVAPAKEIDDPEQRLRVIIRQHARLLTHEAGALAILIDEDAGLSDDQREEIVRRKREYFEFLRQTLEELKSLGRLRPEESTVGAFSLLGMVMWIARWYDAKGRLDSDQVVDDITAIALAGMVKPRAEEPLGADKRVGVVQALQ